MSNVEKNFSGFVKMVIGVTGLVAMGAVVASGTALGALTEGFKAGGKAMRDAMAAQAKQPENSDNDAEAAAEQPAAEAQTSVEVATAESASDTDEAKPEE